MLTDNQKHTLPLDLVSDAKERINNENSPNSMGCVCLLLTTGLHSQEPVTNWPQFRGADARGISTNKNLPDRWSDTENVEWKVDVPGRGWGSPIVWGDKIFLSAVVNTGTTERLKKGLYMGGERPEIPKTNHQWKVMCLDLATGKTRWRRLFAKEYRLPPRI